ncbi:MAG: S-adenosylmethionine:tRNA ribosyltransferase-isomerase [candidate division WS2 bacterium]|nr:S-adenosylmethionine:tRNA ribosyltransferase-isomerase [Candidatus Lithacetigena glycinireducens]
METRDFEYYLPLHLIAQTPIEPRDDSRLLILYKNTQLIEEGVFGDITKYLSPGDVLVLNDSRVIPARLSGKLPSGGKVEVFLLKHRGGGFWEALVKPGKKLNPGKIVLFGEIKAEIVDRTAFGGRIIKFPDDKAIEEIQDKYGSIPLPPYIKEPLLDQERYQTVFAEKNGSTAAPTAALHFTPRLLEELKNKGVEIVYITLHMGLTSFRPIKEDLIEEHKMESEYYCVPLVTAQKIRETRERGSRIFACGTDTVRTLETTALSDRTVKAGEGFSELFITPGYQFKVVDAFITNLHLPRSSHLVLVSAFAGRDFVLKAYDYAINNKFRFYSFGDATLVL